jgi:hypothetical protein
MSAGTQAASEKASCRRNQSNQSRERVSQAEQLLRLRDWLLPSGRILVDGNRHGNTKWEPSDLIWLALCWGWAESKKVTDAFETARDQCRLLGIKPLGTYQGFMNALVSWTDRMMPVLWQLLHQRMRDIGGELWQIGGWVPIGFDGSRSSAPRTTSNEKMFCAANYGRGKTAQYRKKQTKGMRRRKNEKNKPEPQEPQVWSTLLWHMGLRLPWMWRLGPSNSSERAHVLEMLDAGDFPKNTLFCGDAGFIGYPFWARLVASGCHFLIRVGANVRLLTESTRCTITQEGRVLCWPKAARQSGQAPLRLRLFRVKIGNTSVWMLTSVLEPSRLTRSQAIRLYKIRWGIEVELRGLKQTLDRARLRCRNGRRLLAELNWSIMAMAVAELFALKEQLAPARAKPNPKSPTFDPQRRSLAQTMRALRSCLSNLRDTPPTGLDLPTRLRLAVTDNYIRRSTKHARYRPRNPDKKPLGDPQITTLPRKDKKLLVAFKSKLVA